MAQCCIQVKQLMKVQDKGEVSQVSSVPSLPVLLLVIVKHAVFSIVKHVILKWLVHYDSSKQVEDTLKFGIPLPCTLVGRR